MRVIHYGASEFLPEFVQPIKNPKYRKEQIFNKYQNKPEGGLWTSPVDTEEYTWKNFLEDNDFRQETLADSFMLDINLDNLFKINSFEDLMEAGKLSNATTQLGVAIDFEALSKLYQGIYLTSEGEWATRYSDPVTLYGWDVATVFLFSTTPIVKVLEPATLNTPE